ncbi:hypothetical protein [Pseudalkalibacillus decolorationis]|uniref:hypothetical protein n=1 Tax=Pseudalkalibacillus decolorationis TaxID=163879 RepID=UPI002148DAE4|nr:hypothetical protein [Pseudalkalibacillus decolorationis]
MSEEKLDKLLNVMVEMKGEFVGFRKEFNDFRKETNEKLDTIESNIELLASKTWNNEKDIYRMKNLMGIK